jgi:hypothetical protein
VLGEVVERVANAEALHGRGLCSTTPGSRLRRIGRWACGAAPCWMVWVSSWAISSRPALLSGW